jgi:hypothetical protein
VIEVTSHFNVNTTSDFNVNTPSDFNIVTTLKQRRNLTLNLDDVDLTLKISCSTSPPNINVETTLIQCRVSAGVSRDQTFRIHFVEHHFDCN